MNKNKTIHNFIKNNNYHKLIKKLRKKPSKSYNISLESKFLVLFYSKTVYRTRKKFDSKSFKHKLETQ